MGVQETLVIYGIIGCVVAVALVRREDADRGARQVGGRVAAGLGTRIPGRPDTAAIRCSEVPQAAR